MSERVFGTQNQMRFSNDKEFFQFLGYLAKSDGSSSLVWEHNENQGAWASEGRIQLYAPLPYAWTVNVTAGVGNIVGRINCNEFIEYIRTTYGFVDGKIQDISAIKDRLPNDCVEDFEIGLTL